MLEFVIDKLALRCYSSNETSQVQYSKSEAQPIIFIQCTTEFLRPIFAKARERNAAARGLPCTHSSFCLLSKQDMAIWLFKQWQTDIRQHIKSGGYRKRVTKVSR